MKRFLFFSLLLSMVCLRLSADDTVAEINLQHKKPHDHNEHYIPADQPDVYYDSDNLEIILVADGFSSYYDVYITPTTGYMPLISTQVDGYGDTIDVSSLPVGCYAITIISEFNNEFEGTFSTE